MLRVLRYFLRAAFLGSALFAALTGCAADVSSAPPKVDGRDADTPLHVDLAALAQRPHEAVEASEHGTPGHWQGVKLIDLLRDAGVPAGEALRGRWLAAYVRVSAADGYRAVFSLAELDPAFRDGGVFVVDRRDGKPLDAKEGPLRIIAVGDKRPARWVRQIVAIDVLSAPDARGAPEKMASAHAAATNGIAPDSAADPARH